ERSLLCRTQLDGRFRGHNIWRRPDPMNAASSQQVEDRMPSVAVWMQRSVSSLRVGLLLLLLGNFAVSHVQNAISSTTRGESRSVFGYDPTPDFLIFDPEYRIKHARYARELRNLQLELARQTAKGRPTPCSRQLFLEARWLVYYSAHWDKIERHLADLRSMLAQSA